VNREIKKLSEYQYENEMKEVWWGDNIKIDLREMSGYCVFAFLNFVTYL
jgi:hypothetical protein